MFRILLMFLFMGFSCLKVSYAQNLMDQEKDLSPVEDIPIALAQERGTRIYQKDQYAWKASDILFADPNLDVSRLRGWVTEIYDDSASTYYVGVRDDGSYFVNYQVDFDKNMIGIRVKPIEITDSIREKFAARMTAQDSLMYTCGMAYNSVVLEEGENIIVYWLSGTAVEGEIPIGGHFRFTFKKGEENFIRKERMSNTCLRLNHKNKSENEDAEVVMTMFSHVVSEQPQDVHVFLNLLYGDLAVSTSKGNYLLQNGNVFQISERNE